MSKDMPKYMIMTCGRIISWDKKRENVKGMCQLMIWLDHVVSPHKLTPNPTWPLNWRRHHTPTTSSHFPSHLNGVCNFRKKTKKPIPFFSFFDFLYWVCVLCCVFECVLFFECVFCCALIKCVFCLYFLKARRWTKWQRRNVLFRVNSRASHNGPRK